MRRSPAQIIPAAGVRCFLPRYTRTLAALLPSVETYDPLAAAVVPLRVRGALGAAAVAASPAAAAAAAGALAAAPPASQPHAAAAASEGSPARRKRAKSGTVAGGGGGGGGGPAATDRPRQPSDQLLSADAEAAAVPALTTSEGAATLAAAAAAAPPAAGRRVRCGGCWGAGGASLSRVPEEAIGLPMVDALVSGAGAGVVAGAARFSRAVPCTFLANAVSGFIAAGLVPPLLHALGLGLGA